MTDVEAGGLLIDRGLLLGLLFGAQRACVAAFALALGEVKTKVEELGAQGFDFALDAGRTSYAVTTAPRRLAVPMACRPAIPAPE